MNSNRTNDPVHDYILSISQQEPAILQALREKTANLTKVPPMHIGPDQGQFMQLLIKLNQTRSILELGTFTGYSALWMALALPDDGHIISCDIKEDWSKIAREHWMQAGVADKITLKLQPALTVLAQQSPNQFDMIFIDADKANYPKYYEQSVALIKPGGVILVDNIFCGGRVMDKKITREAVEKIRETSAIMKNDHRMDLSIIPIGDSIALARKK
jgi:predicted O-methyltransferase YrrM